MAYAGEKFEIMDLKLSTYNDSFFQLELDLESDILYEMRSANGWIPHRINEAPVRELKIMKSFFNRYRDSFYFMFEKGELIGSTMQKANYLQSVSIARKFQGKGLGELLTMFAVNKILEKGFKTVELDVFSDNFKAFNLYNKLGFKVLRSIKSS
jgi:ribosomal protein S18 acetylase RimI-like enzyme